MNINYNFDGKQHPKPMPKGVQIMIYFILGVMLSIGILGTAILAQVFVYFCALISNLV